MRAFRPEHCVAFAVAVLVVAAAVPAAAGATERTSVTPALDVQQDGPEFASSLVRQQRGDVARFSVRLQSGSSARVTINGLDVDYSITLEVRDEDGNGRVTVLFNTYLAGTNEAFTSAGERDDLTMYGSSDVDGTLPVGTYRLKAGDGNDIADMEIEPRSTGGVSTMIAPEGAFADLRTPEAVDAHRQADNLTKRPAGTVGHVAAHDTLVLRLEATGLSGALDAQPGGNDSERLRALLESDLLTLSIEETNPETMVEPARLRLDGPGVRLVAAPRMDRYYVVVDTDVVEYRRGEDDPETGREVGSRFEATMTVEGGTTLADDPETVDGAFRVVERSAELSTHTEAGLSFLAPADAQNVTGRTTVAPGTSVRITARTADGDRVDSARATVRSAGGNGTVESTLDLSGSTDGARVELLATDDRGQLATPQSVAVRRPAARLGNPELVAEGGTLYATLSANLTRGGLVTARVDEGDRRLLGVATVEPDDETVSVPLSDLPEKGTPIVLTAVRDLDGDGTLNESVDVAYAQSDSPRPVQQTVALYRLPPSPTPTPSTMPDEPTPSPTATPSPPTSPSPTPTPTDTPTTASPADGGDGGDDPEGPLPVRTPGFGALAALAALLAALAVAARRR